jgi:hypothetical protein
MGSVCKMCGWKQETSLGRLCVGGIKFLPGAEHSAA